MANEREIEWNRYIAAMDQFSKNSSEIAKAIAGYFHALVESDLTREEALELTVNWQAILGMGIFGNIEKETE